MESIILSCRALQISDGIDATKWCQASFSRRTYREWSFTEISLHSNLLRQAEWATIRRPIDRVIDLARFP